MPDCCGCFFPRRPQVLASQLITQFKLIWEQEELPLWLRPVRVMVNANNSGIMETITDALSVHSIKKQYDGLLNEYFVHVWSP
jgi:phosphatidylinositol 4-kinase